MYNIMLVFFSSGVYVIVPICTIVLELKQLPTILGNARLARI